MVPSRKQARLSTIRVPARYNYIACFLTLDCNLRCDYCINLPLRRQRSCFISGREWVSALNRLRVSPGLPVTLQGGEPSLHPDFIWLINHIRKDLEIDILTNLSFDADKFISEVDPFRLKRHAPYPNIRVSYHPGYMDLGQLIKKALRLRDAGFSIGIFSILHPRTKKQVEAAKERCAGEGIDFRAKEFLGVYRDKLYGKYFYPQAVRGSMNKRCFCRTSELIISPSAEIFRCHRDLYRGGAAIGSLRDDSFRVEDVFRPCACFGDCNPCDIKLKNDRFQVYGYHAVEIKMPEKEKGRR